MFLIDFLKAIDYLVEQLGSSASVCFQDISFNMYGNCVIFRVNDGERYRVWRYGRIDKVQYDTWRNPKNIEILCEGNGKNVW